MSSVCLCVFLIKLNGVMLPLVLVVVVSGCWRLVMIRLAIMLLFLSLARSIAFHN